MVTSKSNTQLFLDWLETMLEKAPNGLLLGTLSSMAAQWGVNERTIRRRTHSLYVAGRLHAVPGKGVLTGPPRPAGNPLPSPSTAEKMAQLIAADIRAGVLKRGEVLPAIKTLALTLRISRANAGKAYALLENRGLLVRLGKRFLVTTSRSVKSLPRPGEVLIVHQHHDIRVVMSAYDHHYSLTEMELELLDYGVRCRWISLNELPRRMSDWSTRGCPALGVVFTEQSNERYGVIAPLVRAVRAIDNPKNPQVLLVGETVENLPPDIHMLCGGTTVTAMARAVAGFAARGPFEQVALILDRAEELLNILRIETELASLSPQLPISLYIAPAIAGAGFDQLIHRWSPTQSTAKTRALLERYLSSYTPRSLDELSGRCYFVQNWAEHYRAFPKRTLCVYSSDEAAAQGYSYCSQVGRAIPEEISLIGSGNDYRYFHQSLTTCVPDWCLIGYLMAHALLNDLAVPRGKSGFLRVKSRIIERGTTP